LRWGDYSALSVDPVDDCTFWYTNHVAGIGGAGARPTRIASFRFESCKSSVAQNVNSLVAFVPIEATFASTTNTAGCPAGFAGKFSFTATLTDNPSSAPLADLQIKVNALSGDNLLQNADGGPAGVGATLTVAKVGQYADGLLSPGESVDVPFVICLKALSSFDFLVDVLGATQ
jgi:hypothetical protein